MDRISAIRNVESALVAFEDGEIALETLEERVTGVLRTYATEFEGEDDHHAVYQVHGTERAHPLVIVAPSPGEARERARGVADLRPTAVERVSDPGR